MISPGLYAQWRAHSWKAHTLAERPDGSPLSEHVLQLVWQHQRLRRDELQTIDGQALRIFHPGFWNHEPGPDFHGAVLQFGDALARNGDVEVDLSTCGWHAHHHDQNPDYKHVILHVVWEADPQQPRTLPTLALKSCLDAPLDELALSLRREPQLSPAHILGQCSTPLEQLTPQELLELLIQAAQIRFESKAGQLHARGKQVGWERALWEGLFGALGYKNNVWPMRRISEVLPALTGEDTQPLSTFALQVRLLGVSGLLPTDVETAASTSSYLRNIWNVWWREREQFTEVTLPRSSWRLGGLRPANHPQRRLALAAHWLTESNLPDKLEQWFATAQPDDPKLPQSLFQVLQANEDEFWSRHWSFRSAAMSQPQPLIGAQRVTDLAINVILPWFWVRAAAGQNLSLQRRAEACYFAWPAAEDNSVLRLARRRLFREVPPVSIDTAAIQQGILQVVRDFCDYSNALCANCKFPELVAELWAETKLA